MGSLDHLKARLERFKQDSSTPLRQRVKRYQLTSFAICAEIVACIVIGLFVGSFLDNWFATTWIFKISCLVLSFFANMVVLYRIMNRE